MGFPGKLKKSTFFEFFASKSGFFWKKGFGREHRKFPKKKICWKIADIEGLSGHYCSKSPRFWTYGSWASFWCRNRLDKSIFEKVTGLRRWPIPAPSAIGAISEVEPKSSKSPTERSRNLTKILFLPFGAETYLVTGKIQNSSKKTIFDNFLTFWKFWQIFGPVSEADRRRNLK